MKLITNTFFLLIILTACQRKQEISNMYAQQQLPEPLKLKPPVLTFNQVTEKAVLIGYDIELLDSVLNIIRDISDYNELMVDVSAISRAYYYHYNSYNSDTNSLEACQKFKYVRIKSADFEGIVEGQYVYRVIESSQNKVINTNDNKIEFLHTSNYGIRNSEDDETKPCTTSTPLVLRDQKSSYEGLVTILNREPYKLYFPYLELSNNEAVEGEFLTLKVTGLGVETTINARFEMGPFKGDDPVSPATIQIRRENNGKFTARFLEQE